MTIKRKEVELTKVRHDKNSLMQSRRYQKGCGCLAALGLLALLYYGSYFLLNGQPAAHPQLIAHRGAHQGQSGQFPENTMAAFRNAVDLGADWLEMDVQMTQDGQLVVIHDETVDRTTNGSGRIADLTLAEIRALEAGNGEQIPTFKEVIEFARYAGVPIMPEAKSPRLYPGLEAKMVEEIMAAGYADQTVIQSFDASALARIRALNPNITICALHGLGDLTLGDPQPANAEIVAPMAEMVILYPWMIWQAHRAGHQVYIWFWIMEHPLLMQLLLAFGADGLMVDDMAMLVEISGR
jgi:glycerophosphoryl diester phosphodiesterase